MSKVVFFNIPAHGHINPTLAVVNELTRRGEEVFYLSTCEFKDRIKEVGADFIDYGSDAQQYLDQPITNLAHLYRKLLEVSILVLERFLEAIRDIKPDYIIHDAFCPWGRYMAQILNIPAICSISTFAISREGINFSGELIKTLARSFTLDIHHILASWWAKKKLRNGYRIKDMNLFDSLLNRAKLNIVYTSRDFQPNGSNFDNDYHFVGPSIRPRKEKIDFSLKGLSRPVIYISLGTILNQKIEFYRQCFTAFSDFPGNIILSVGQKSKISELGKIPGNFIVKNYLPQLEVLKSADLFISHGGMNSVHEALYYQVPLIVIPGQQEQEMVARQVEKKGCGIYMSQTRPQLLRGKTEELLKKRSYYQNNLKEMSYSLKNAGGYHEAARQILKFKESKGID